MEKKKSERIKELTWKYFWEQKIDEAKEAGLIALALWGIAAIVGWMVFVTLLVFNQRFVVPVFVLSVIPTVFWIGYGSYNWISSNWKQAERRALKKLRRKGS